jgi:hypothetical protein
MTMSEPETTRKTVKFFRITFQLGGDEYVVVPLEPNPEVAKRAFRLRKLTGDGGTYDVRVTEAGAECDCKGFQFRKRCKHCGMLREAMMID